MAKQKQGRVKPCPDLVDVEIETVELFTGATFKPPRQIENLGQLKQVLNEILGELETWGDDSVKLAEVWFNSVALHVMLAEGKPT